MTTLSAPAGVKYTSIKQVFDHECAHQTFGLKAYKAACQIQEGFVNKKREHIEFFGGNLTGVQVVRFTDQDREKIFDILLQADEDQLKEEVYALKDMAGSPTINQDWIVSSDIFNISCVWLMHAFHHSHELTEEQKIDAKARVCVYMIYKFLTSLFFHYFKYPADKAVAAATYASLSQKYSLKKYGSWGAALMNMAIGLVGPTSIWYKKIETMDDDYEVVKMLNDIQGRVKDMLKNIYAVFIEVNNHGGKISTTTSMYEVEGEFELKDQTESLSRYTQYLKRILADQPSFIKDLLVNVVSDMMPTMPPRMLYQTLAWTSDHYKGAHDGVINEAIDLVMEHAIEYLNSNRDIVRTDIAAVLDKLRGAYMSSRSTDPKLLKVRSDVEKLVRQATNSRNENAIAAVRTAWMLYIVVRAYTMRHYTNN